jgi:hypothetical protein
MGMPAYFNQISPTASDMMDLDGEAKPELESLDWLSALSFPERSSWDHEE